MMATAISWPGEAAPQARGRWRRRLRAAWRGLRHWFGVGSPARDPAGLDDKDLIRELRRLKGQRRAQLYEELVRRHQSWLVRLLVCLVNRREDAEDLAQEVFVKALMNLDSFRGDASFKTWLRTIATRAAFNWQRDHRTARRYEEQAVWGQGESWEIIHPGQSRALIARETLTKLLSKLSYPYREILILRYVEELSLAEIAQALDLGGSAAKMRLKRAREQMEILYKEAEAHA
jgi:RNA polymerase sigma-70 factor (ECF subfamily)